MTSTELRVRELLVEEIDILEGQDPETLKLDLDSTLEDWGLNSLAAIQLVKRVNSTFGTEISPTDAAEISNLRQLIQFLEAQQE